MIRADMIPDEVVDAAACLLCHERHPCWSIVQEVMDLDIDMQGTEFRHVARAAIAAALNAWPGAETEEYVNGDRGIFLPLPQEPRDE